MGVEWGVGGEHELAVLGVGGAVIRERRRKPAEWTARA